MFVATGTRDRFLFRIAFATLLAAAFPTTALAVGYVNPVGANHIAFSICPAVDGANFLDPDPVEPLGAMSQAMLDELTMGDTPYPGWSFQSGLPLNGTFHIDQYQSRFRGAHWSGARINARYLRGPGDPPADRLRWVQLIDTTDPIDPNGANPPGPPAGPYLDPYPDDADGQGGPFYYSDEMGHEFDYRDHVRGGPDHGFGADYDAHFFDFSSREHPPTSWVEWHAQLHLTELSAPMNVIFYEGFRWGFKAGCIHWLSLLRHTFGSTGFIAGANYDPATGQLSFSTAFVNVLNDSGSFQGVDPEFAGDPLLNAQIVITPFRRREMPELPPGLALFEGGSIQVFGPSTGPLFIARIPLLVLGDDMNVGYNMTGVYADLRPNLSAPSPFLQGYEQFRRAGIGGGSTLAEDRTNPNGQTSDVGTTPSAGPGHTPQFYARSARPIAELLANGGPTAVNFWNSFGPRDPQGGLDLRVSRDRLDWGDLGTNVRYDVVLGDLGDLRQSGGDLQFATAQCLGNDVPDPTLAHPLDPSPGEGLWFLVRGKRGALHGTYDTLQPSQVGSRDPGINATGLCGP